RFAAFSMGVLAVLLVAALFVPRGSVTIRPESQVQSLVIPVTASPAIQSVFLTGSVPAGLETLIVEGSQTVPISAQITIPQTKARGIARFENLTESEVRIPAGTVIFTLGDSPVRFA